MSPETETSLYPACVDFAVVAQPPRSEIANDQFRNGGNPLLNVAIAASVLSRPSLGL